MQIFSPKKVFRLPLKLEDRDLDVNYSILFLTAAAPPNVSSTAHILSGPKDDGGVESVKLQETKIAGRSIACFFIGGEARCCLPQILNSILDQISLPAIHLSCDQLQINCSTCTMDQMEVRLNPGVSSRGSLALPIPRATNKSAFSTNTQSRFASIVPDGVLGPLRLARHT